MAKAGSVLNNLCKAVVLGDESTKSGSDVYGEGSLLHAEQLEVLYSLQDDKCKTHKLIHSMQ